MKFDGTS